MKFEAGSVGICMLRKSQTWILIMGFEHSLYENIEQKKDPGLHWVLYSDSER